jgi:hypothetical protein
MKIARREIHHSEIRDRIKPAGDLFFAMLLKKMPANAGRAQPKIGPRDAESGAAHRVAARLSAITHIGCVYADEPSIRAEYDPGMTHLKRIPVRPERMRLRLVYCRGRIKKSPLQRAGLKLFSWRRIVETGEIMLRRDI